MKILDIDYWHDTLHSTQWGANLIGFWHTRILNHRSRKDLLKYLDEATEKSWYARTQEAEPNLIPQIEEKRQEAIARILTTYNDIPEDGYDVWEEGYWNGVMATLRWVLGDEEKDNLDT